MSVPNQTPYIIYNANGLTTVFPFEFYIINAGDIQVSINGDVVTSGYTVSGTGNVGGGDITFITPPTSGSVVMLERVVPTYRLTDYQDNGDLLADTVNKDFDRLWMAIQRAFIYLGLALRRPLLGGPYNAEGYRIANGGDPVDKQDFVTKNYVDNVSLVRALRVPEASVSAIPPVSQRANKLLAFNAAGQPIAVLPESGSASEVLLELASTQDGKGDALIGVKQPFTGGYARTQHDKNTESLSIKDFGAIGDGANHPLSERYATLAAAQAVYPFVTALTQTIDYAATQAALNAVFSRGGGAVFIPAATSDAGYQISTRLVVPDKVNIYGEGYMSCLTATSAFTGEVVALDWGPYSSGRFLRHFRISGADSSVGLGTTIDDSITQFRYVYGFHIDSVSVQGVDTAFQFQGLWHTKMTNCTSGNCRVGLDLWGQNVSVNVNACHFRQQNVSKIANSYGIRIRPRTYTFHGAPIRSEAIIVDGETMCIGFNCGVDLQDALDVHFSELDLDYCQQFGLLLTNVDGGFSFRDSWIAADLAGTAQFFGVQTFTATSPSVPRKTFDSLFINGANANPSANNIGINIRSGHNQATISNVTFNTGNISIYGIGVNNVKVENCLMGSTMTLDNCQNWTIEDCRLSGLTELNKPVNTFNTYRECTGTPAVHGKVLVPMASNASSGTLAIPLGSASLTYLVNKLDRNIAGSNDTVSVSGTTITVNRATPVATAIGTYVEFMAI